MIVGVDPDPANAGAISRWARDYWEELHPTSAGSAYLNFVMDEGNGRVRACYPDNYDRLTGSSVATTRTTCSTSTRTSRRPTGRDHPAGGCDLRGAPARHPSPRQDRE